MARNVPISRVRSLILQENFLISVIAGAAGVFGGFLFLRWVNTLELLIPNELIVSLLGGPVLTLEFLPGIAILSFVLAVVLGLVASIYPMETTVRIEPMAALRQG